MDFLSHFPTYIYLEQATMHMQKVSQKLSAQYGHI